MRDRAEVGYDVLENGFEMAVVDGGAVEHVDHLQEIILDIGGRVRELDDIGGQYHVLAGIVRHVEFDPDTSGDVGLRVGEADVIGRTLGNVYNVIRLRVKPGAVRQRVISVAVLEVDQGVIVPGLQGFIVKAVLLVKTHCGQNAAQIQIVLIDIVEFA